MGDSGLSLKVFLCFKVDFKNSVLNCKSRKCFVGAAEQQPRLLQPPSLLSRAHKQCEDEVMSVFSVYQHSVAAHTAVSLTVDRNMSAVHTCCCDEDPCCHSFYVQCEAALFTGTSLCSALCPALFLSTFQLGHVQTASISSMCSHRCF